MLSKKHLLFLFVFLLVGSVAAFAQDGDEAAAEDTDKKAYPYPAATSEEYKDFVPKKRHDQQDKFIDGKYNFPAKPRDKWELGLNVGALLVSGDVKTGLGKWSASGNFAPKAGIGLHIRKSFGYVMSMRVSAMAGTTWGQNWQSTYGWAQSSIGTTPPNRALAGTINGTDLYAPYNDARTPDYFDETTNGIDPVFYNYQTKIREIAVSGIANIHNIRFHKQQTGLDLYGIFGIGGFAYRTMMDQLDANDTEYDYRTITTNQSLYENRSDALDALEEMRDGTFESQAERHFDDFTPFDNFSFKPTAHIGVGVAFKLSRVVNLGLETKVTYTNDDLLDGQRWQEWGALTRDYDTYTYTALNLNFNLGGKNSVEPLWWMNPLDYSYEEIANECCDELDLPDFSDDDNDGVPNAWDKEPDSREDCPVDTHGRMLDSDRDGVLDCDDECPHSSPYNLAGEKLDLPNVVNEVGCYIDESKIDCDRIDDFCKCAKACVPPPPPPPIRYSPPPCYASLPNILFDLNKYSVKEQFSSSLGSAAQWLRDNPTENLCVVGHTDVRGGNGYNDVLSWKRANEVVNKLVSEYGADRSRLKVQFRGEIDNEVGGLEDSPFRKAIDADHGLNRRVEFKCCNGNNSDMSMPAGPSNAGSRKPRP